jgi:hypothetical protein
MRRIERIAAAHHSASLLDLALCSEIRSPGCEKMQILGFKEEVP